MSDMVDRGSKYTDEQRRYAAAQYAVTGTLRSIEKETGIPNQTLSDWKGSDWWLI